MKMMSLCFIFSSLLASSAFAKTYTVKDLYANAVVDCTTLQLYASDPTRNSDYEMLTKSIVKDQDFGDLTVDGDVLSGKSDGFNFSIDDAKNLVINKKGSLFSGKGVSITLGGVETQDLCAGTTGMSNGLGRVLLPANIQITVGIELTGSCSTRTKWPNGPGESYLHDFTKTLTIADSLTGKSLVLKSNKTTSFEKREDCEAGNLPE